MGDGVRAKALGRVQRLAGSLAQEEAGVSRDLAFFFLTIFLIGIGAGVNRAAYSNLLKEDFGIGGGGLGILEALREVPGLLTAGMAAATARMLLPHLGALSLAVLGLGYAGYALSGDIRLLVFFVVFASFGFHSWLPVRPAMAMGLARPGQEGHRLGQAVSVTALATIAGMGLVIFIARFLSLRQMFLVAGAMTILAGAAVLPVSAQGGQVKRARFVFRRRYMLFYVFSFLLGCRKQITSAFAVFALVQAFGAGVRTVATLLLLESVLNLLFGARLGRLVDGWGERKALTLGFGGLTLAFLGYALVPDFYGLCGIYLAMILISNLPLIGVNTYLRRIASQDDMLPSLSLGQSIDHLGSVIMPLVEGALYALVSYQAAFLAAAGVAFVGMAVSWWMEAR